MKTLFTGTTVSTAGVIHDALEALVGDVLDGVGVEGHPGAVRIGVWTTDATQQNLDDIDTDMVARSYTNT